MDERLDQSVISDVSIAVHEETGIFRADPKNRRRRLLEEASAVCSEEEFSGLEDEGPVCLRGDEERRKIREQIN